VSPGKFSEELVLSLPKGNYFAEWINPADGAAVRTDMIRAAGKEYRLKTPEYPVDIALRIKLR
jgi:hypothetical protein